MFRTGAVYTGTFGNQVAGENGLVAKLKRTDYGKTSAELVRVRFRIDLNSDTFNREYSWRLHEVSVQYEDVVASGLAGNSGGMLLDKMSGTTYTAEGELTTILPLSDEWEEITVTAKLDCNYPSAQCRLGTINVFFDAVDYAQTEPFNLLVNQSNWSTYKTAKLTWSQVSPGKAVSYSDYFVRASSSLDPEDGNFGRYTFNVPNGESPFEHTVPADRLKSWVDNGLHYIRMSVVATDSNGNRTQYWSNAVTFKLRSDNTIAYHDGEQWMECLLHYHDGIDWIQCDPHYYDGNDWIPCSNG